jgi:CarD family transcriptional regulator
MLESHSCNELLELAIKIYSKKQAVKKLGFIDEKHLKRTEELLFGELAAALDIPPEVVPKVLFGDI